MGNNYPDPWNFSNTDKNLVSPNGKYKVEFGDLHEIAMGAPISGKSFLILGDKRIKLNDQTGGPIIWNESSDKVAMPVWGKDRLQRILVADITNLSIAVFERKFRVLQFKKFDADILSGIDSPIYMTTDFHFDLNNEKIDRIEQLG